MTDPMTNFFFNAHHSPIGAFASFTLGYKGSKGGLGLELSGPADESIYVGVEDIDAPGTYHALPFFEENVSQAEDFDVEGHSEFTRRSAISAWNDDQISRGLTPGVDTWSVGDFSFSIISPVTGVPEPGIGNGEELALKNVLTPAVLAEITVDNRNGKHSRRAFFGYRGSDRTTGMRLLEEAELVGIAQHTRPAIATNDPSIRAGVAFQPEKVLDPDSNENLAFYVGNLGLLVGIVEPGEVRTFKFAVGFFVEGTATTGIRTKYLYRRWFDRIEQVLSHALDQFDATKSKAKALDHQLSGKLSVDRAFMVSQAIRSYFGSTQLLEREDGRPLWVVNEGEYRMMNTFDLTIDQAFFELALNPWTVRNVLDLYVERYSYIDEIRFPGQEAKHPGGLAFTHDMGVSNAFSRPEYSGYEQSHLKGCFSYMSAEELMNWVLTAGLYEAHTKDLAWTVSRRETFLRSLASLMNRDNPEPSLRNGVTSLDADRCQGGAEITTYDSLDTSLGQARNNLYLAVKGWACYMTLEPILRNLGEDTAADHASDQATKAIKTILESADADGLFPAVIGEGVEARIIPAIEALVYPYLTGRTIDPDLKIALNRHFEAVLNPGICRFDDGGWRLSSTSQNSWLSKIYLCQFVAEQILGHAPDEVADQAHVAWLLDRENAYFAWSDQMLAGKAVGSRYYPRGVTSALWLLNGGSGLEGLSEILQGLAITSA